jgi:hypothetical protein
MSSEIHLTSLSNVVTTTESKSVSLGVGLKTYCQYFYAVSDGITIKDVRVLRLLFSSSLLLEIALECLYNNALLTE